MTIQMLKTTALGTCLSLALALPSVAQDSNSDTAQSDQSSGHAGQSNSSGGAVQSGQSSGQTQSGQTQSGQSADAKQSDNTQSGQNLAPETVVALVGTTEILGADVIDFVTALPPRMRQQPPQMLMSMALDQVILRELLLQEARSQNLADDPRVTEIVDRNTEVAREDAMVAVYLQDQMSERVSDAEVEKVYEQLQGQMADGQILPPLDQLRPQIEQQLQQQALQSLRQDLVEGVEVVVYGAQDATSGSGNTASGSETGEGSGSSDSQ